MMKLSPADASEDMIALVPVWCYVAMVLGGLALGILYLRMLDRIPMENRRGNMDTVSLDDMI